MGIIETIYNNKEKNRLKIRQDALREAKCIADVLGKKFGATEVILYGSLSREGYFDMASDIDIAVKGLGGKYLRAYGFCIRLSRFNLDIRAYEDMPYDFRCKIDREGRALYEKK